MALPKHARLKHPRDFSAVYRQGQKAVSQHLVLRVLTLSGPSPQPAVPAHTTSSQFGISISQKVSKRAVIRNRIKRQIRSAIRALLPQVKPGLQIVVVVRPGAPVCEYGEFLRELEQLFTKLEVIHGRS
ncbi:MAG TPA: ribonuclease P protein component [Leptolyngbyaceae cyanobacterium]